MFVNEFGYINFKEGKIILSDKCSYEKLDSSVITYIINKFSFDIKNSLLILRKCPSMDKSFHSYIFGYSHRVKSKIINFYLSNIFKKGFII